MRRLALALAAMSVLFAISVVVHLLLVREPLYSDFFGFWTFGHFAAVNPPAQLYDQRATDAFQHGLGMPETGAYPFSYPPWSLLAFAPLGYVPFGAGLALWLVLTGAAYVIATVRTGWPWVLVALLVAAPSSVVCAMIGQNGFLSAALLVGGLRLLRQRPWIAGLLLGLLAYKPQLALMVPFALLAGRHWTAMAGAVATGFAMAAAATLAFGSGIWGAWLDGMRHQAGGLMAGDAGRLVQMSTVTSAVQVVGGSLGLAFVMQIVAAFVAAAAVWTVRARSDIVSQAVIVLATFVATPHAFYYDLPATTAASLSVIGALAVGGGRAGTGLVISLFACLIVPILPWSGFDAASALIPLILLETMSLLAWGRTAQGASA